MAPPVLNGKALHDALCAGGFTLGFWTEYPTLVTERYERAAEALAAQLAAKPSKTSTKRAA